MKLYVNVDFAALLGEADLLTGQMVCPRSPPDALASFIGAHIAKEEWIVPGICAYVPQVRHILLPEDCLSS